MRMHVPAAAVGPYAWAMAVIGAGAGFEPAPGSCRRWSMRWRHGQARSRHGRGGLSALQAEVQKELRSPGGTRLPLRGESHLPLSRHMACDDHDMHNKSPKSETPNLLAFCMPG